MQIFYVLPVDVRTINGRIYRGPMYLRWSQNPTGIATQWGLMDYGGWTTGIVLCPIITPAQHASLISHPDVVALPEALDQPATDAALRAALTA